MGKVKALDPRKWTEENMIKAVEDVINKKMGVNEASRFYEIPSLRRHILKGWKHKQNIGRPSELGYDNEVGLVAHIKKLESIGFPLEPSRLQSIAYDFAEKLKLPHRFNGQKKQAGWDWLQGFMKRQPDICKRKAEGLSLARASGMNRQEVSNYFDVLLKLLTDNDLIGKPERVYNMDESGIHVNNKARHVLASKGAKCVNTVTSTEKAENIYLIACCNAEGTFLPPVLIMKVKYKKPEFSEGLPPGSDVYTNQKSFYINAKLFFNWIKNHFIPRKPDGKVLLILDGHSSHSNSFEMLQLANENGVIILCLPSHTTQALQPMDRAFFKPFKSYLANEIITWFINNKGRPLSRYLISQMIGTAWYKSATPAIGVSGFKATGIYPYDPNAIPEYFFRISDASARDTHTSDNPQPISDPIKNSTDVSLPSTSTVCHNQLTTSQEVVPQETPTKTLQMVSPLPTIHQKISKRKQNVQVLTSENHLTARKLFEEKKKSHQKKPVSMPSKHKKNYFKDLFSSAESEEELQHECSDESENTCVECQESYYHTKKKSDWIQCVQCSSWLHESCTLFLEKCNKYGAKNRGKGKGKKTVK